MGKSIIMNVRRTFIIIDFPIITDFPIFFAAQITVFLSHLVIYVDFWKCINLLTIETYKIDEKQAKVLMWNEAPIARSFAVYHIYRIKCA